ncbi:MAG: PASTA domain-containing protein [Candidatus Cloacimonadia bacterium]
MKVFKRLLYTIISLIIIFTVGYLGTRTFMHFYTRHRDEVVVPDLIGKDYENAQQNLYKVGLYIDKVGERNSDDFLEGSIITQTPPPNSVVKRGYTIDVIISKGPELVKVPILDNLSLEEAKIRLQNIGLKLGKVNYSYSNEISEGKIIYSQPVAGVDIPKNSSVTLVVSLGEIPKVSDKKGIYDTFLEGIDNPEENLE